MALLMISPFFHRINLQTFFPAMTKIVGTLGPKSQSVDIIASCLKAGMSGIMRPHPTRLPITYFLELLFGSMILYGLFLLHLRIFFI